MKGAFATLLLLLPGLRTTSAQPAELVSPPLIVGGHAGAVAIGDLNRDGRPDIVVARLDTGTLVVYLGDGRGRFRPAAGSPFAAGSSPEDVALGDFNEDGNLDVAVANHETSYLSLLLGNGAGALPPASSSRIAVPSHPHPHGVAAGDFDGDRHLDLAVESRDDDEVVVLHGIGNGVFPSSPTRLAVGRGPYYKLRAGDLNADGRVDLVTTNTDGSSVSVLLADDTGGFRPATEIATARVPFAVAIGDVNGDRDPDLAVAHRWGAPNADLDRLTVLLGSSDGTLTVSPWALNVGTSPTAVGIADFDGDGFGDVAVANMGSNDVTVLLGSPSGLRTAEASPVAVGRSPGAIAVADLNDDGKADIVTGNWGSGDVSVVLSR